MLNFYNLKLPDYFRRPLRLSYGDTPVLLPSETIFIVAPADYWVVRVELQVKSPKEAELYSAGLFELSESHRYAAQKVGKNSYIIIAYDPAALSEKLNASVNLSQIEKITFAQWVFAEESSPISLGGGKYLSTLEGIVIEIDGAYIEENSSITLYEALRYPKYSIRTLLRKELIPSAFTPKTLKTTLLILVILLGNLSANAFLSYHESLRLQEEMEERVKHSNLPATSIEREAILASLKIKEHKQLYFRQQCKKISDIPIERGKNSILPPIPILPNPLNASADGIVLIPGSSPSEANRLMIDATSHAPSLLRGTLMQEIRYEGDSITLIVNVGDSSGKEKLKNEVKKRFKKVHITERETQMEVRLQ
jgi:hypothetical protein